MIPKIVLLLLLIAYSRPIMAGVFVFSTGVNLSVDQSAKNLVFATKDAEEFSNTMRRVGDVPAKNIYLQKNVTIGEFVRTLKSSAEHIKSEIAKETNNAVNKVVFFFSGHSDERGFHFPDGFFSRKDLDHFLDQLPIRTKVVIIDSCFSGTLASKGTKSIAGFGLPKLNFDEPTGSIYLSATSATDFAFESKKLGGGLFSKNIIAGLYGAGDSNGDGVVTATELYEYAFRETQIASQLLPTSQLQKPEFRSSLNGRGAIALSFPSVARGDLQLANDVNGTLKFYASNGVGTFEHIKAKGGAETLTLPAGKYRLQINDDEQIGSGEVDVKPQSTAMVTGSDLAWNSTPSSRTHDLSSRGVASQIVAEHHGTQPVFVGSEGGMTFNEETKGFYGAVRLSKRNATGILFPMLTLSINEFRVLDDLAYNRAEGLALGGRVPLLEFGSTGSGIHVLLQVGGKYITRRRNALLPMSDNGQPFVRAGFEVEFLDHSLFASVGDEKWLGTDGFNFVVAAIGGQRKF
jgi:Caspase domain